MPPTPPESDRLTPRVVFFGPPHAGKSSLIRAFLRALGSGGQEVEVAARGDAPGGLRRELVPHLIRVPDPAASSDALVLCDCDGQAARDLLAHPDALVRGAARGALADAVRAADALVLVVDAAADPEAVDATFRAFHDFLAGLEDTRSFGREVGGLPVFLTLTKCDALARPGDGPTGWLARVEARKRELEARFEESFADALADPDPASYFPFGSVDLFVTATAVRTPDRPAFDAYADPDGSFGLADLADELLPAARAYRSRLLKARQRLKVTIAGVGTVVGLMLAGMVGLAAAGVGAGDPLADRVRAYREAEGSPAVRLSDRNFTRNRGDLAVIRESPGFARLPGDLQRFVDDRLKEFDAYRDYRAKFQPPRLGPPDVRTREELAQLEAALAAELAPPPEYAAAWTGPPATEAVRLRSKWQADVTLLGEAEGRVNDWYRGLIRRANQLILSDEPPDFGWRSRATAAVAAETDPPFRGADKVPGSPAVPVRRGAALTYAPAFEFDRIDQARRDWADARDRLLALRSLADALGLTTGPGTPPPVLALPEPGAGVDSLGLASARLRALADAFPDRPLKHPDWSLDNFPDPARRWLEPRLKAACDAGVRHVHRLIRDRLGSDRPDDWRKLADTVLTEPPVKDWGRLLGLLRHWAEPSVPGDPVRELADFLRRDRFDLAPAALEVSVPDDLLGDRLIPSGKLVLRHTPADGPPAEVAFRQDGDGRRDRPVTTYRFVPDGPPATLTYRPGDGLTASLPLRSGPDDYRLTWAAPRSAAYQFDALARPPALEKAGPVPAPEPAPGVRVTATPDAGLPAAPVLLPPVR